MKLRAEGIATSGFVAAEIQSGRGNPKPAGYSRSGNEHAATGSAHAQAPGLPTHVLHEIACFWRWFVLTRFCMHG